MNSISYANGSNPYANGRNPYANGANPYANGAHPGANGNSYKPADTHRKELLRERLERRSIHD